MLMMLLMSNRLLVRIRYEFPNREAVEALPGTTDGDQLKPMVASVLYDMRISRLFVSCTWADSHDSVTRRNMPLLMCTFRVKVSSDAIVNDQRGEYY